MGPYRHEPSSFSVPRQFKQNPKAGGYVYLARGGLRSAKLDLEDKNGWTPILHAVYNGQGRIAELLGLIGAILVINATR